MTDGKDGAERSVSDVLAAIRARVKAEEAGLSARPNAEAGSPLRLTPAQEVEDAMTASPPRRETGAPLRLDAPVGMRPLRLDAPFDSDSAPEIQTEVVEEHVPEAPHIEIEDEVAPPVAATVTPLFASRPTTPSAEDNAAPTGDPATLEKYDVWTPKPETPPMEYDVWTPQAFPESLDSPNVFDPVAQADATNDIDADAVRAIVREVLSGQPAVDTKKMRAEIREIIAQELEGALGEGLAKSIRKSVRKDIIRAFKDRGLN